MEGDNQEDVIAVTGWTEAATESLMRGYHIQKVAFAVMPVLLSCMVLVFERSILTGLVLMVLMQCLGALFSYTSVDKGVVIDALLATHYRWQKWTSFISVGCTILSPFIIIYVQEFLQRLGYGLGFFGIIFIGFPILFMLLGVWMFYRVLKGRGRLRKGLAIGRVYGVREVDIGQIGL